MKKNVMQIHWTMNSRKIDNQTIFMECLRGKNWQFSCRIIAIVSMKLSQMRYAHTRILSLDVVPNARFLFLSLHLSVRLCGLH